MTCVTCTGTDRVVAKGEHKIIKATVYETNDDDAVVEDLTGYRLILAISAADDPTPLLQKDTNVLLEAVIQTQSGDTKGQCWFFLLPEDWPEAGAGVYDMEVWLDDGTGVHERVLTTTIVFDDAIDVVWT